MEKDVKDLLKQAAGWDDVITYVMRELEHCDDMIYNENLSAANYIYWMSRKETLQQVRNVWCKTHK